MYRKCLKMDISVNVGNVVTPWNTYFLLSLSLSQKALLKLSCFLSRSYYYIKGLQFESNRSFRKNWEILDHENSMFPCWSPLIKINEAISVFRLIPYFFLPCNFNFHYIRPSTLVKILLSTSFFTRILCYDNPTNLYKWHITTP